MVSSSKGKAKDRSSVDDLTETEFETQGFEPQDGDEELLWDVVAILAEKGDKYLIKWAGTDDNGQPWPDSWVPRPDVTDDLVQAWRKEKALKKRERARAHAEARERKRQVSNVSRSRTDSKGSTTTTLSSTSRLTTRATSGVAAEREDSATSISLSSPVKKKRKQKFGSEEDDGWSTSEADAPRKRRRLSKRGRDSQSSSSLKKLESRSAPTEDPEGPGHKPKSRKQIRHEQEGEEEGYDSATAENARPNGRDLKVSRHSERKSSKVIQHEHEEEEEDGEGSTAVATPKSRRAQRLQVEVVVPPSVAKSKPARDTAPNGSPDRLSIRGRRRAHSKSGSERASNDASIEPSINQFKNHNGKTRKGSPGVRSADVKDPEGDGSAAEQEDDMLSTVETANRRSSEDLLSPRGSEQTATTSPSKLQRGLTARMKGKEGRKILGRESETSVQNTEIPAVAVAHDVFDEPELDPIDDIDVYDYDALDDAPPISKADQPTDDHRPAIASFVNDKNVVPDKLDEVGLPGEPQSPKGPVVPPTQSQSQSQRESQLGVSDDLHLASILAEHGSASEQADSSRVEILHVPTSSITDPQPSAESNVKAHKKIPAVTPSKFKPYLLQQKPLSALPPPHLALHSKEDESDIASQSPLKDFDERVTGRMHNADHALSLIPAEDAALADVDDIEDEMPHSLELQQRGLELAEMRRRKLREEIQKPVSRISLHELLAKSSRSGTPSGGRSEGSNLSTPDTRRKMIDPGVTEEDTLETEIDETRIRQFEEAFLDFDGNAGDDLQASLETAGEEEEEEQCAPAIGDTSEEADAADVESSLQDLVDENDPFLSHGEVTERATTPTTSSSDQDDTDQPYTPVKRRFKILGSPNKMESPLLRTPSQQLNEAMGLLHAKSEEIEHLKRQLEESIQKRLHQDNVLAEVQAENAVLKKTIENRVTSQELDEELIQQHKEKEEGLAKEILARDAEIRLLKMNWDDAVKQAEVFRESYERASAFAGETKERNVELEERARLAEAQVKSGLNLYRKQYDAKIEKLEMELERQRIEARIIKTRDTRTDDEVRRRAALEPELREQIDSLGEEIRDLKIAQGNIVRQRNELLVENQDLKKELEGLRSGYDRAAEDLTWSKVQVARLMAREKAFKKVFLTNSTSILDSDNDRAEEKVFVCKWMSGFDGRTRCNSLFTNVQELKDHLFVDHQL